MRKKAKKELTKLKKNKQHFHTGEVHEKKMGERLEEVGA